MDLEVSGAVAFPVNSLTQLTRDGRKSQIAIEYSYRFRADNPGAHVFWVYAANAERFDQAYKDIAEKLGLPRRNDPNADVCQLVFEWLNQDTKARWLMVVDNADDGELFFHSIDLKVSISKVGKTKKPLNDYLPRKLGSNRHVLFTTRHRQLGEDLAHGELPIEIKPFEVEDAKRMLRSKAEGIADDQDGPDSERLLEVLGFIPLAISQAAAFMRRNRMSQQRYLTALEKDEKNLTEHLSTELRDPRRESAIPNSIFRTWKLSFNQIQEQEPRATEILSLSAMLDRQQIPEWLLRKDDEWEVDFSMAIGTLEGLSLITKEIREETFSMHRLVQLSVQAWLEQHKKVFHFTEETLKLLADRFPYNHLASEYQYHCQSLYPHAHATLQYRLLSKSGLKTRAILLHDLGLFDRFQGRYSLGHERLVEAYDVQRRVLGEYDSKTLLSLASLGDLLRLQGKYQESEEQLRLALKGQMEVFEPNDKHTLRTIYLLAMTLRFQKKDEEAESEIQKVLEGHENIFGTENAQYLVCLGLLASITSGQGNYETAEEIQRRVVNGQVSILGAEHSETLTSIHNLAGILRDQGKYEAAEKMLQQAVEGYEKTLGPEHPYTLDSITSLADTFREQGLYEAAEEMYQQAIIGYEKAFGADHPYTLRNVGCLAAVFREKGFDEVAEEMYRRVIRGFEKISGPEHSETLTCIYSLAGIFTDQGKYEAADELYRRAVKGYEKALGLEHEYTLNSVDGFAYSCRLQERYGEASALFERLIAGRQKTLGPDDPKTVQCVRHYSEMLDEMRKMQCRQAKDRYGKGFWILHISRPSSHRYRLLFGTTLTYLGTMSAVGRKRRRRRIYTEIDHHLRLITSIDRSIKTK